MLAIRFTFIANRYHATQWGRHVNEGVLEWPPSPWRILRAIVATWRRTLPDMSSDRVRLVLDKLASEYPKYHLPTASTGHTRHYMPYYEGLRERTTMVIDSFVAIKPKAPVFAIWSNFEADPQQRADLNRILQNMPYLGRAESWVEATLDSDYREVNSYALESGTLPEGDWEIARTLVPREPVSLEVLEVETSALRGGGRIDPEGAQWWPYVRRPDCFTSFRASRPQLRERGAGATVVRFALAGKVRPMAFDTLRWGELARKCAMSQYGRQNDGAKSPKLSGKDASGKPLEGHQHAFYLPTDEDGDGQLDHLTVWTPGGLEEREFQAVVSMTTLNPGGGRDPLQLAYQAHGCVDDFVGVSPLFCESRRWRSLTPYVLTRHVKLRGPRDENGQRRMVDGPADQIAREMSLRYPESPSIVGVKIAENREPIKPLRAGRFRGFRPFDFFTYRQRGSSAGRAFNFQLEFEKPICGPVALGFACHYGLGLFVPD